MRDGDTYPKFRPIVSFLGTHDYELEIMLNDLLTPLLPCKYSSKDTFSFLKDLQEVSSEISGKYVVSYDAVGLFTLRGDYRYCCRSHSS